jgi:RNase H-fold protein (predicted Holliday junction resolvase)
MKTVTVTAPKKMSKSKKEDGDWDTVESFRRAMEDIKHGRISKWDHNMKTMTVEKKATKSKAKNGKIDWELIEQFRESLEDIKHGRIKKWEH